MQAGLFCQLDQLVRLFHVNGQGLLREHVLAVQQRGLCDLIMLVRTGEVQNHVHFRIVKCLIHILINLRNDRFRALFDLFADILHALFRALRDQVANADELDFLESQSQVFQINAADRANADHCNFHHDSSSFISS